MTDTTETTPTPPAPATVSPAPAADHISIDAANVLHDASNLATDARKETERDTRHGLSHLEDEFLAEWRKLATYSETDAKKLLAWVAKKLAGGTVSPAPEPSPAA